MRCNCQGHISRAAEAHISLQPPPCGGEEVTRLNVCPAEFWYHFLLSSHFSLLYQKCLPCVIIYWMHLSLLFIFTDIHSQRFVLNLREDFEFGPFRSAETLVTLGLDPLFLRWAQTLSGIEAKCYGLDLKCTPKVLDVWNLTGS